MHYVENKKFLKFFAILPGLPLDKPGFIYYNPDISGITVECFDMARGLDCELPNFAGVIARRRRFVMKFTGKGSMENVPIHGTLENKTVNTKSGERNIVLLRASGSMTPEAAQTDPNLAVERYKDDKGKENKKYAQVITPKQAEAIRKAGTTIPLTNDKGESIGRDFVAFSANVTKNSAGTGVIPDTSKPMGANPLAKDIQNEAQARDFMKKQRDMSQAAWEMANDYAKQNGLDPKTSQADRDKMPVTYDVKAALEAHEKAAAEKAQKDAAEKAEKAETPKKTRSSRRKLPDAPEAPQAGVEAQMEAGD